MRFSATQGLMACAVRRTQVRAIAEAKGVTLVTSLSRSTRLVVEVAASE